MARLIGVVLARGGSAGVARKNLRLLCGAPLLVWTLTPACEACDVVLVVSDDREILALAEHFRVVTHDEPAILASGRVGDLPVIQEALFEVRPEPDDVLVLLRPTAPFRRAEEIKEVAALLGRAQADSVRSVVPLDSHPQKSYIQCGWTNLASPTYPQNDDVIHQTPPTWREYPYLTPATDRHRANHPRQWLQPAFRACGFIDAVRADVVIGMQSMEGDILVGWPAPIGRASIEIDSEGDFLWATAIAHEQQWRPGEILL